MPTAAVIDLVSDDEDSCVEVVGPGDDAQAQRPARNTVIRHRIGYVERRPPGSACGQDSATIDLTGNDDRDTGAVAGRPGSASLASANEARADSRPRNQNTSARTPRTTAGGSSEPRAPVSGDAGAAPKLTRVSAKAPPAALNSDSPPMFPGRIAHRPGNPYGQRQWGAAASSTRPPPPQDGFSPARPQVISDDDDDDDAAAKDNRDDDLLIDEEKSTPANTHAHPSGHSREHVRKDPPPAPVSNREPSPIEHLTSLQRQLAEKVKVIWGVYPWEVTSLNPPQFHADLVCDFYELAQGGCSLEAAKESIEGQIKKRSAASDGSPGYVILGDTNEARKIIESHRAESRHSPTPIPTPPSHPSKTDSSLLLPPHPLPHSLLPLNPPGPSYAAHSKDSTSSRPMSPVPAVEQSNPASLARAPSFDPSAQQQVDEAENRSDNASISDSFRPRNQCAEAQDRGLVETVDGILDNPLQNNPTETERRETTEIAQSAPSAMETIGDIGSAEPSDLKSDSARVVSSGEDLNSELARDLIDVNGNVSMLDVRKLIRERAKAVTEDREYFTKARTESHQYSYISNTTQFRLGRARRIHRSPDSEMAGVPANDFISGPSIVPKKFQQDGFPWKNAPPIQTRGPVKPGDTRPMNQKSQEVFPHGSKGIRSSISNPIDFYAVDTLPVPPYTNYVSLKQNVLAENHRTLLVYPYFDDNQDEDLAKKSLWDELQNRYNIVADELRLRRLLQAEKSWQLRSYADRILGEFGCGIEVVLRYFLLPPDELKRVMEEAVEPQHAQYLEKRRKEFILEEYDREKKKWRRIFDSLPPSRPNQVALAAMVCTAWAEVFKFSFWHIARRTPLAQPMDSRSRPQLEDAGGYSDFSYRDFACRVCHLHNCPFHGAILEQVEPGYRSDSEESDATHESSDSTGRALSGSRSDRLRRSSVSSEASLINFKKHVNAQPRDHPTEDGPFIRRSINYWKNTKTHIMEQRPPFFPCSHKGNCSEAKCSCFKAGIQCEKTCACAPSCKRRFRGCTCAQEGLACAKNKSCDCWGLNRECDPDLCASCGAAEVLDPVNRYNDALYRSKCGNVNIQRNVPRRTLLGQSEVQGFGLYAGEKLNAGDFVGEYKGEVVTKEEGSRRGAVYQHLKTNYLFDLNRAQEVDSTRAGNKLRFINNSAKAPNCEPRVMLCNTVVRIGLFANKDLEPGEEMFFNYNYPEEVTKHFWEKGQAKPAGSAYAVKTKKGTKGKGKVANSSRSSDSEFLAAAAAANTKAGPSNGKALKTRKPGPGRKAVDEGRSRVGETPLRGSSTISRYTWAAKGKRPRLSALEKQKTWEELNDVLDDEVQEDRESDGDYDQYFDSEEDGRARKRARKAKV
ncbi:set domain-containing protein [Diplodia corticola]|uniref:Set domain-containing protein n=1 Tax=Diplodia corticola TaxID=236234 RepID=A0A1J9QZ37_9PEZI|nr:set domain-containing protein [Diplodia corticola]OJD33641.1 set domain-containing protein [Diplodia corticola]